MEFIYGFIKLMETNLLFATAVNIFLLIILLVFFRAKFKKDKDQLGISKTAFWIMLILTIISMSVLLAHLSTGYPAGQSFWGDITNFATLAGLFYIIDETNQKLKREYQITSEEEISRESLIEVNEELEIQIEELKLELNQRDEELINARNDFLSIKESLDTLNTEVTKSFTGYQIFNERLNDLEKHNKRKSLMSLLINSFLRSDF